MKYNKLNQNYINETDAAEILTVSTKTLQTYRREGTGPDYYKVGRRVIYGENALLAWLETKRYTSTSQYDSSNGGVRNV